MRKVTDPDLRKEILEAYFNYYNAYTNRRWSEMTGYFTEVITMFGTGIDEVSFAGHTTISTLRREFSQAPEPISYKVKSKEVYEVSKDVALLMLTMDIELHNEVQEVSCPDNRTTAIMVRENGYWKLAHGHWSQPDKDIGRGESVPYRLLLERSRQLEEKVEERTRKISAQRDELKRLNETKNKLFSVIAHDLKNPFNSIIGFSDLLMNNPDDFSPDKVREIAGIIHQQSESTHDLLEHLLEWARSQTGSIAFRPEKIVLDQLFREVKTSLEAPAKDKDISLACDIANDIRVEADKPMLQIILRNLLHNAVKFSHPGGEVRCRAYKQGSHVSIVVEDDGIGMDANTLKGIRDGVLSTINAGTANEYGTGLGLLLCREYIARHDSRLDIHSEQGRGSSFFFNLPAGCP